MSFENTEKWKRHVIDVALQEGRILVKCKRCKINDFPLTLIVGQIVCTRYDRLYLKDLPEAVDCAV